jgi:formate-dependent nitrite reductase cytochrome c552 subunit
MRTEAEYFTALWAAVERRCPPEHPLAIIAEMLAADCDDIATEAAAQGRHTIAETMDAASTRADLTRAKYSQPKRKASRSRLKE